MDCKQPGATTRTLPLNQGFWRASVDSVVIRECFNEVGVPVCFEQATSKSQAAIEACLLACLAVLGGGGLVLVGCACLSSSPSMLLFAVASQGHHAITEKYHISQACLSSSPLMLRIAVASQGYHAISEKYHISEICAAF